MNRGKSAKYFLNLEKHNKSKTDIRKLIAPESDSKITDFTDIQKEIKQLSTSTKACKLGHLLSQKNNAWNI